MLSNPGAYRQRIDKSPIRSCTLVCLVVRLTYVELFMKSVLTLLSDMRGPLNKRSAIFLFSLIVFCLDLVLFQVSLLKVQ